MDTGAGHLQGPALPLSSGLPRLFWVTDDDEVGRPDFVARAEEAVQACGSSCAVQLRAHAMGARELWRLSERLKALTEAARAGLWVNDRVGVALAVRADGVQLGVRSMRPGAARRILGRACWIGCSAHAASEVTELVRAGADMVVLGHVYATSSHQSRPPLGLGVLRQAVSEGRPVVAIGGISDDRVREVMEAGAWGVAVRSGIWGAGDVAAAARRYLSALETAVGAGF